MALMTRIMDYQKAKVKRAFEFFVADLHEAFVIDFRLAEGLARQSWFTEEFGSVGDVISYCGMKESHGHRFVEDGHWDFNLWFPSYKVTKFDMLVELAHALVDEESLEALHGQEFLRRLLYMVRREYSVAATNRLRELLLMQRVSIDGYDIEWFAANEARKRKVGSDD